jgi:hypothetical protein
VTEFYKALEAMTIKGLDTLSDSQFLGFVAMQLQESKGALPDYMAKRVDMIALRIQAEEVGE